MGKLLGTVAALALLASPASAALLIAGDIGGTTFTCADQQAACDTNPLVGTLALGNQTINGVQVNGSIQTSTKGGVNILDTSSLSLINVSGANRTIAFTVGDTDFVGPVDNWAVSGSGTWQNAIGSSITMRWYNDPTNTQGAESTGDTPGQLLHSFTDTVTLVADAFSTVASGAAADPNLFSMTETAFGTLVAGGSLVNRGQTEIKVAVIEPGSLALLGSALLMGGLALRRSRA